MAKLLIVEDNEMNRDMLSRRLRRKGYDIEVAMDGQQGIDKATALLPDLVLMDMSLPVKDGWTATRELRENAATATLKIIALTAHAMEGDRQKAIEAGCDDYDTKPIDLKRLLAKIEALL
jgi:CheY-like chemotaxis protein